jgi:hypothetical protein
MHANYLVTIVFGLKMNAEKVQKLIENYYEMVELGLPFMSCFPEEFVLSALLWKPEYRHWTPSPHMWRLFVGSPPGEDDTKERLFEAQKAGYFFYQRTH